MGKVAGDRLGINIGICSIGICSSIVNLQCFRRVVILLRTSTYIGKEHTVGCEVTVNASSGTSVPAANKE